MKCPDGNRHCIRGIRVELDDEDVAFADTGYTGRRDIIGAVAVKVSTGEQLAGNIDVARAVDGYAMTNSSVGGSVPSVLGVLRIPVDRAA